MNTKKSTVYIVTESSGKDFVPALKFGEPSLLLKQWEYQNTAKMVDVLYEKLRGFDPQTDYLVMAGEVMALGAAVAIIADYADGPFNVLKWDRNDNCYVPHTIDMTRGRK